LPAETPALDDLARKLLKIAQHWPQGEEDQVTEITMVTQEEISQDI
jgi:hypothetical protein